MNWEELNNKYPKAIDKLCKDSKYKIKKQQGAVVEEEGWKDKDMYWFIDGNNMHLLVEEITPGEWIFRVYKDSQRYQSNKTYKTYATQFKYGVDKALELLEGDL